MSMRHIIEIISGKVEKESLLSEHMEVVQYGKLLTENARTDFLLKTYGEKLVKKYRNEWMSEPANIVSAIASMQPNGPTGHDTDPEADKKNIDTIARKILNYITQFDPTNNGQYVQWLVIRYLKNGLKLEDLERARTYLEVFARARSRIQNKDINSYSTLADLFNAVQPFIEGGQEVSAASEKDALLHKMSQPDQAEIFYDDANLKIVSPKTMEASCYWGVNTQWCTAATGSSNYFDTYNKVAPLYILIFKKQNRRYQFQFRPHGTSYFMDERDHAIDVREFFDEHPYLIKIFGQDRFRSVATQIGLKHFDQDFIDALDADTLIETLHSKADLKKISEKVLKNVSFQKQCAYKNYTIFKFYPTNYYADNVDEILESNWRVFKFLPDKWKTQERADYVGTKIERDFDFKMYIPTKLWSESISKKYWSFKVEADKKVRLNDIPEQFWSESIIFHALSNHIEDIAKYTSLLTPKIANDLVYNGYRAVQYIPKNMLTKSMLVILNDRALSYNEYSNDGPNQFYKYFPPHTWTQKTFEYLALRNDNITFAMLPDDLKTLPNVIKILGDTGYRDEKRMKHLREIPLDFLTPKHTAELLRRYSTSKYFYKYINPQVLTDDIIVKYITNDYTIRIYGKSIYEAMPKQYKTEPVMDAFAKNGLIPVAELPKRLISVANYLRRAINLSYSNDETRSEIKKFPKNLLDRPDFARALVKISYRNVEYLPNTVLDEPILFTFLSKEETKKARSYGSRPADFMENQFKRFPKSVWSPRTVALAVKDNLMPADLSKIPQNLVDESVVAEILRRNPDDFANVPANLMNEEMIAQAVARTYRILEKLKPEQITTKIAENALSEWSEPSRVKNHADYDKVDDSDYSSELRKLLRDIPRDVWSKKAYEDAVGYVVSLQEVPRQYRDNNMIDLAIKRDAGNARILKDPAVWMNAHMPKYRVEKPKHYNEIDWTKNLERSGLILGKKGFIDVNELPKKKLKSGYEYATIQAGPKNIRAYLFDSTGKYLTFAYTAREEIIMPDAKKMEKYRRPILELAQAVFIGNSAHDLTQIGIHSDVYKRSFSLGEETKKTRIGDIEWTDNLSKGGIEYAGYFNDKKIIEIDVGGKKSTSIQNVDIIDMNECIAHAKDIAEYLTKHVKHSSWQMQKIGIITKTVTQQWTRNIEHYIAIPEKKLGTVNNIDVWTNKKYIGLFKDGMRAYAVIRKDGSIGEAKIQKQYDDKDLELEDAQAIFDKIGSKAQA